MYRFSETIAVASACLPERALFMARTIGDYFGKVDFPVVLPCPDITDGFARYYTEDGPAFHGVRLEKCFPHRGLKPEQAAFREATDMLRLHQEKVLAECAPLLGSRSTWVMNLQTFMNGRIVHGDGAHIDSFAPIQEVINILATPGSGGTWIVPHRAMYAIIQNSIFAPVLDQELAAAEDSGRAHWSSILQGFTDPLSMWTSGFYQHYKDVHDRLMAAAVYIEAGNFIRIGGHTIHWREDEIAPNRVSLVAMTKYTYPLKAVQDLIWGPE